MPPVLGEHARKVVSRVQPYLATHFTAPSGVENVGSRQATNNVWTRDDIAEGKERDARDLAAYGVVCTTGLHRPPLPRR